MLSLAPVKLMHSIRRVLNTCLPSQADLSQTDVSQAELSQLGDANKENDRVRHGGVRREGRTCSSLLAAVGRSALVVVS